MPYGDFYKFINKEIDSFDNDLKISTIVERYAKKNNTNIASFINEKSNYTVFKESIKRLEKHIVEEKEKKIHSGWDKLIKKLDEKDGAFNIKDTDIDSSVYLFLVYTLIVFIDSKKSIKHSAISLTKSNLQMLEKNKQEDSVIFYRGHSDISWRMLPCFVRGLDKSAKIDKSYIKDRYKDSGLLEKFNNTINIDGVYTNKLYSLYSFVQHAVSYSVLIDLTSDATIGTSFALSNTNAINNFNSIDSCLIMLKVGKEKVLNDEKDINDILEQNSFMLLYSGKFCFGKNEIISGKTISFQSFNEIYEHMKPQYYVFSCPTNDRMKYQQGSFIYFYGPDLIIFKDKLFYELCNDLEIIKYEIKRKVSKRSLIKYIKKERYYFDQDHLLNPYKYFNE